MIKIPTHATHDKINIALLIIINVTSIYYKFDLITILIFSIAFIFGTYYISPDIDVDSRIYRRWGLLRIFWKPYKDLFKHRGISHNLILGPISLLGYLACLIFIALYLAKIPIHLDSRMIIIAAGMVAAIELHILADMLFSKK